MAENTLFYGDNLKVLREHIPDASVDLIYLDPPFNSNRAYNVLFKEKSGEASPAQIEAFDDTWTWDQAAEATYVEIIETAPEHVGKMIAAMREFIGSNDMMAYLVMMAIRLVELHRVLKPTGSLYLHCDPTASHYLKVVLDTIFGGQNYRNEIVWKRQSAHSDARNKYPDVSDAILFYGKSPRAKFTPQYVEHDPEYVRKFYRFDDRDGRGLYRLGDMASPNPRPNMMYEWMGFAFPAKGWRYERATMKRLHDENRIYYPRFANGDFDFSKRPALKRYLDEQQGSIVTNVWTDIISLHSSASERLGYPTQKPMALLERIISASSNPGDVVLDPFCGCGTAVIAAEKLGRKWIGIDVTHLAIALMKSRLMDSFGLDHVNVVGLPSDVGGARALFAQDPYQFQFWAAGLVNAMPRGGKEKKGADRGIDGVIPFIDGANRGRKECLVQVKGGKVQSGQIRDLRGTMEREKAEMALFITLNSPTSEMRTEAAAAGFYRSELWGRDFPRIQIATIDDLLANRLPQLPVGIIGSQQAPRLRRPGAPTQAPLMMDAVKESME